MKHKLPLAALIAATMLAFGALTAGPRPADAAVVCGMSATPDSDVSVVSGTRAATQIDHHIDFSPDANCTTGVLSMRWVHDSSITFNAGFGPRPINGEVTIVLTAGDRNPLTLTGRVSGRTFCNIAGKCQLNMQVFARSDDSFISYKLTGEYDRQTGARRIIDCEGYAYLGANVFP